MSEVPLYASYGRRTRSVMATSVKFLSLPTTGLLPLNTCAGENFISYGGSSPIRKCPPF